MKCTRRTRASPALRGRGPQAGAARTGVPQRSCGSSSPLTAALFRPSSLTAAPPLPTSTASADTPAPRGRPPLLHCLSAACMRSPKHGSGSLADGALAHSSAQNFKRARAARARLPGSPRRWAA